MFGINYVILSDDKDFREMLEKTFEVTYTSEQKIELEAQLFSTQLLFQFLFSQGRLEEARAFILNQSYEIQQHRVIRNLLAMCYLYLGEYDSAKAMFEELLKEDNSDVHALCHYTLYFIIKRKQKNIKNILKYLIK